MSNDERIGRITGMPLFPFDGEFTLKELGPRLDAEIPREGEGDKPCRRCNGDGGTVRWSNDRFLISDGPPTANPICLFLETVDHVDFDGFDDEMAAELGVLTMHLSRAIEARPRVGRTHIHRWGDGSEHYHLWFQGRPARQLELFGWGNILWSQVLDPAPLDEREADLAAVLADFTDAVGGRRLDA